MPDSVQPASPSQGRLSEQEVLALLNAAAAWHEAHCSFTPEQSCNPTSDVFADGWCVQDYWPPRRMPPYRT